MKDKSIKQPWPRSAKITVWVLGVLLLGSLVLTYIVQHILGQEIIDLISPPEKDPQRKLGLLT